MPEIGNRNRFWASAVTVIGNSAAVSAPLPDAFQRGHPAGFGFSSRIATDNKAGRLIALATVGVDERRQADSERATVAERPTSECN
jgi:hypothetical protein